MDNDYNQYGAYLEARARDRELHEEFLRSRNRPQAAPPTQHIDFEMETVGMPAPPANGRLYQEGESVTCLEMHVPLDQIPDHLTWAPIPPQGDYICVQKDEDEPVDQQDHEVSDVVPRDGVPRLILVHEKVEIHMQWKEHQDQNCHRWFL